MIRSFHPAKISLFILACGVACLIPWAPVSCVAALILVLWLPGKAILHSIRQLDHAPGRGAMIVAASIVLLVIPLSWFWRISNAPVPVIAFVVGLNLVLTFFATWVRRSTPESPADSSNPNPPALLFAICLWTGVCIFGSFWIPTALNRTDANPAHDYIKHHAILFSLGEHTLPLRNAFTALEPETAYYYYEYHYLLAATIRSMTGDRISIPFVFGLTSGILAIVVIRLVFWMSLRLTGSVHGALLSAACVSVLGGWDIVPVMLRMLGGASMPVILDSWCPVAWRIHNLMTQFYWCPQHVAALCALLLASYWLTLAPS
ncbi:MAG: hypothetical protein GXP29_03360, partial [Planctomycetes bacterium]|nr:hypothetical protein [Planctomycetota bacterium]